MVVSGTKYAQTARLVERAVLRKQCTLRRTEFRAPKLWWNHQSRSVREAGWWFDRLSKQRQFVSRVPMLIRSYIFRGCRVNKDACFPGALAHVRTTVDRHACSESGQDRQTLHLHQGLGHVRKVDGSGSAGLTAKLNGG